MLTRALLTSSTTRKQQLLINGIKSSHHHIYSNCNNKHYIFYNSNAVRTLHIHKVHFQSGDNSAVETKQFITPELYFKPREELNTILMNEVNKIVTQITQSNTEVSYTPTDIPGFILGTQELRSQVFQLSTEKFGREIPSRDLPKIITVQNLVDWFVAKILSERPKTLYQVPDAVKSVITKNQQARREELKKKNILQKKEKRDMHALKRHKLLYGDTDLTVEQVAEIKRKLKETSK